MVTINYNHNYYTTASLSAHLDQSTCLTLLCFVQCRIGSIESNFDKLPVC